MRKDCLMKNKTFSVVALDSKGNEWIGKIKAKNKSNALSKLRRDRLTPVDAEEVKD